MGLLDPRGYPVNGKWGVLERSPVEERMGSSQKLQDFEVGDQTWRVIWEELRIWLLRTSLDLSHPL